MIEIIHIGLWSFLLALGIYSFFDKREIIQISTGIAGPLFMIYSMGYSVAKEQYLAFGIFLTLLIGIAWYVIWRLKNDSEELRSYTREELITAQLIYHRNYMEDPEGYKPGPDGTPEEAEETMDYLLGIIDGNSEKFKKVRYESRLSRT